MTVKFVANEWKATKLCHTVSNFGSYAHADCHLGRDIIPRSGDTETDVPFSQVSPQWLNLRSKVRTLAACNLIDVKGFANRFLPFFDSESELVLSEDAS